MSEDRFEDENDLSAAMQEAQERFEPIYHANMDALGIYHSLLHGNESAVQSFTEDLNTHIQQATSDQAQRCEYAADLLKHFHLKGVIAQDCSIRDIAIDTSIPGSPPERGLYPRNEKGRD